MCNFHIVFSFKYLDSSHIFDLMKCAYFIEGPKSSRRFNRCLRHYLYNHKLGSKSLCWYSHFFLPLFPSRRNIFASLLHLFNCDTRIIIKKIVAHTAILLWPFVCYVLYDSMCICPISCLLQ